MRNTREHGRRADEVAHLNLGDAGNPVNQGADLGESQVQFGLFDGSLVRLDSSLSRELGVGVIVQLALRNGVRLRLGNIPLHIQLSGAELRLGLGKLGFGLIQHGLKRTGINLKQHIALVNQGTFAIVLLNEVPRHLGLDLGVDVAVQRRDPFAVEGDVLLYNLGDLHHRRASGRRRLGVPAPSLASRGEKEDAEGDKSKVSSIQSRSPFLSIRESGRLLAAPAGSANSLPSNARQPIGVSDLAGAPNSRSEPL